ncbi:Uncharacterised protein [uncultured archaeon]|nr:Uncharacterised protein [uncultured archaeon]
MKENEKIMKKTLSGTWHNSPEEGFMELNQEDKEMYLFLRGGFAAK